MIYGEKMGKPTAQKTRLSQRLKYLIFSTFENFRPFDKNSSKRLHFQNIPQLPIYGLMIDGVPYL